MSAEDFQLIYDEKTDISVIKSVFLKIYHQREAKVDDTSSESCLPKSTCY